MHGYFINCMENNAPDPKIIGTDIECASTCAIHAVFSNTKHLLCPWHLNKTVVIHCKNCYQTGE